MIEHLDWERARRLVDAATARACHRLITEGAWSTFEIDAGLESLAGIKAGKDCCYDRPSIGATYALWYQGRRVHAALQVLAPNVGTLREPLRVVDLGCGTGATACAIALLVDAYPELDITVECFDGSPFMVHAATAIYSELTASLESGQRAASFKCAAWERIRPTPDRRTAIYGGYLLDHSDRLDPDEIASRLRQLGDRLEVSSVTLTTSGSKGRTTLDAVVRSLPRQQWSEAKHHVAAIGGGTMDECHRVRSQWYERAGCDRRGLWSSPPSWGESDQVSRWLRRPPGIGGDALFGDERDDRLYDDEQKAAAAPDGRLTMITGAAGSGKTIVLATRVAETIKNTPEPCRILVTAFNKGVVAFLVREVERELGSEARLVEGIPTIDVGTPEHEAIAVFLNRDKLPHRVFAVDRPNGIRRFADEIRDRVVGLGPGVRAIVERYDARYLEDELERVIYGQRLFSPSAYRDADRFGRGDRMSDRTKDAVWQLLADPDFPNSFIRQRILAFREHEESVDRGEQLRLERRWTHVFVDECQDFTPTDFQLLARVPPDPRALCAAGDASQAMHLGRSYRRPGIEGARWKTHSLKGSYRLPLRICEALRPLAESVRASHLAVRIEEELDAVLLESRKSASPGFRPLVVAGATLEQTSRYVFGTYLGKADGTPALAREHAREPVLLAECGDRTANALAQIPHTRGSMLEFKGLEWPAVVVTNEAGSPFGEVDSAVERFFTAVTRATRLLVIVLWAEGDSTINRLLSMFEEDRVTFLDEDAQAAMRRMRQTSLVSTGDADSPALADPSATWGS